MPYDQHPKLELPKDLNSKAWRYMDIAKFISLLEEQSLYFSNVKSFKDDPYEGSLTKATIKKMKNTEIGRSNLEKIDCFRGTIYVSCWHLNKDESASMWRQYANSGIGLAIQSTVQRIMSSLENAEQNVSIGLVNYDLDYNTQVNSDLNLYVLAVNKRSHFKSDEEMRLLFMDHMDIQKGKHVDMNLKQLIEKIYIPPNSPQWIYDLICKLLDRYGIKKEVAHSKI